MNFKNMMSLKESLKNYIQCNHNVFILMNENAILLYFIKPKQGEQIFCKRQVLHFITATAKTF